MNLDYAMVGVENYTLLNHTKITHEDAFEIIKQNSLNIIAEGKDSGDVFSFPSNFDVIKGLLTLKHVYATPYPSFNQFKDDEFLGEYEVRAFRSNEIAGLVKDVHKYLERGFEVYIYAYYIMTVDKYIDDDLTVQEPSFWYRMGLKQK